MRVFIGPEEIAGYYAGLREGFHDIGIPCTRILAHNHAYKYDRSSRLEKIVQSIHPMGSFFLSKGLESVFTSAIIRSHDVFILGFGRTLSGILTGQFNLTDLEKLKAAGKTVIIIFHGSDVRPPWLNGIFKNKDPSFIKELHETKLRRLKIIEKYADTIISFPTMAALQKRPYASYLAIGIPIRAFPRLPLRQKPTNYERGRTSISIAHAPSNPVVKGTAIIESIVEKLRTEGHLINFYKLQNMPNSGVIETLAKSDLLIDQLYSDTPMAHLAAEAATVGCPSIVCGNDLPFLRDDHEANIWPPSITGQPQELYSTVLSAIEDPHARIETGEAARQFVHKNWQAKQVASRILQLAEKKAPPTWFIDPNKTRYWGGFGMSYADRDQNFERLILNTGQDWLLNDIKIPYPLPKTPCYYG